MEEMPVPYVVRGEVKAAEVDLDAQVPLRVAAVHEGQILASQALDVAKRESMRYELKFPLRLPCGFHLLVGRMDVSDPIFIADPVVRQWVPPQASGPAPRSGRR